MLVKEVGFGWLQAQFRPRLEMRHGAHFLSLSVGERLHNEQHLYTWKQ